MKLYEEQNGKYPEEMNKKEFFSTEAIIDNLVIDDDIYSHLRKAYLASLKGKTVEYTSVVMKAANGKKILKTSMGKLFMNMNVWKMSWNWKSW